MGQGRDDGDLGRVLWVTERYPPARGGMAVSSERLVRGLRRRDVSVDVVHFPSSGSGGASEGSVQEVSRDQGTDIRVPLDLGYGNAAQLAFHEVQRRHRRDPYAVIVGFGAGFPGLCAVTYAAWLGLPSVVLVRGNDFDRDWFEPRRRQWVSEALERASVVGAVSRDQAARIQALLPEIRALWTPNGVDVDRWSRLFERDRRIRDEIRDDLAREGRRVVGLFGELKFKKRVSVFLAALRRAGLAHRVGLLVVGRPDRQTAQILEDPVLTPGPKRTVSFVSRDDLPGYYAACDFVAVPSLFDGMPNVLLEAMASGAVPIVSDASGLASVVEHRESGFVFPAEDEHALAQVLREALELPDGELSAFRERARRRVAEAFSQEDELDRLVGILRGAGGSRVGRRSAEGVG